MNGVKFSRSYSRTELRRSGPKITVTIGHPHSALLLAEQSHVELKKPYTVTALIDTGASRSVISPRLAITCGLRQTGQARISSAGHITDRPEFAGAIHFPNQSLKGFDPMSLVACPLPEQDVACLLGRDVLERWNLTYDGRSGLVEVEE
jgi:gag-polyprotein putative aspartyl protease